MVAIIEMVTKKEASLVCPNTADLFSAKGSEGKGNKELEKPIGLITADEVALAGGLYGTKNDRYYIKTGASFCTMSPCEFNSGLGAIIEITVHSAGELSDFNASFTDAGVRAVINLKSAVLLAGGNGTMEDPYTVKLAN